MPTESQTVPKDTNTESQAAENASTPPAATPLVYEETPILEPIAGDDAPPGKTSQVTPPPYAHLLRKNSMTRRTLPRIKDLLFYFLLFVLGIGASMFLRQLLPSGVSPATSELVDESQWEASESTNVVVTDPYDGWVEHPVVSGRSGFPADGVTLVLPPDIKELECDTQSCMSRGTNLPGGTRLTVALRGQGEQLEDYRNKILTDVSGKEFTMTEKTIGDKHGVEFTGLFTGTTVGGYVFEAMRGFMVPIDEVRSLELNYFIPKGVEVRHEEDSNLFDQIISALVLDAELETQVVPAPSLNAE